jgi:hypothetical protein
MMLRLATLEKDGLKTSEKPSQEIKSADFDMLELSQL